MPLARVDHIDFFPFKFIKKYRIDKYCKSL